VNQGPSRRRWDVGDLFEAGLRRFAEVIGFEAAAEVRARRERSARIGDDALDATEVPFALTWGWLLGRPGLSLRERALILLAVDVATRSWRAFEHHLRLARTAGITDEDLNELLLQVGPYTGFPATVEARALLARTLPHDQAQEDPLSFRTTPDWGELGAPVGLRRVRVVVRDLEESMRTYAALLGMGTWSFAVLDTSAGASVEVAGVGIEAAFKVAVHASAEGTEFELIQPLTGGTSFARQLATSGVSVHDICVTSGSASEDRRIVENLQRSTPLRQKVRVGDGTVWWFDTSKALGGYCLSVGDQDAWDHAAARSEEVNLSDLVDPDLDFTGRTVKHLGVVVRDIEECTRAHARIFGQQRWPVINFNTDLDTLDEVVYDGTAGSDAYLSSSAPLGELRASQPMGGAAVDRDHSRASGRELGVEIIQPTGGPSRYREGFLDQGGEGVHHLYFGPVETQEDWERTQDAFARRQAPMITRGRAFGGAVDYAYFATLEHLGFDIESFLHHRTVDRESVTAFTLQYDR